MSRQQDVHLSADTQLAFNPNKILQLAVEAENLSADTLQPLIVKKASRARATT